MQNRVCTGTMQTTGGRRRRVLMQCSASAPERRLCHSDRGTIGNGKQGKPSSVVAIARRMTIQLLTNTSSCKHTCVGLLAAQQPSQCQYHSTACDKSAKIAASAWWHAGTLRLKLGESAGVPAYLNNWRTPEAQPQGGRQRSQETRSPSKTRGGGARGWDTMGWGGKTPARHHMGGCQN